ncbi:hypothetical protein TNCV_4465761 [Trichonephila clavipes]|nr:hypothetical protein TNCV_4465761 [Trichonephila clavipes]
MMAPRAFNINDETQSKQRHIEKSCYGNYANKKEMIDNRHDQGRSYHRINDTGASTCVTTAPLTQHSHI